MTNLNLLVEEAEQLSVTTRPEGPDRAYLLFEDALSLFRFTYENPGEPQATCDFCGGNHALPGAYGEAVYTSEEVEDGVELRDDVYWARVWATRALDILNPLYVEEPCCEEREKLWVRLYEEED
jgi:hypothetical protein